MGLFLWKELNRKSSTFIGGLRDPDAPTLFLNPDSGEIRWIYGEEVIEIVSGYRTIIKNPSIFLNKYSNSNRKNRGYLTLFWLFFLIRQKSQLDSLGIVNGIVNGVNSFINLLLHFCVNPSIGLLFFRRTLKNVKKKLK